jgi:hypothetical protein
MLLTLCLFFLPILMHIVVAVRKRLLPSFTWLRLAYIYSGSATMLLAAFLSLNGLADRAPAQLVQTSITHKYITSGKTTSYHLVVSSWRPGEGHERPRVDGKAYHAMFVGQPVVVEVHRGLFALSWYGRISPA